MTNHVKPTTDELEAGINQVIEEVEKPQKPETPEETTEEVKEPAEEEVEPVEIPEEPDYKTKFRESSREAQVLASKNRKLFDAIDRANQLPEPTEDELKVEFREWDEMTDTEKTLARKSYENTRRFSFIEDVKREFTEIEEWNGKVDEFADNPKTFVDHPELEGKAEEFKAFASKPSRRGVDMEDLVSAFLFKTAREKVQNKGSMFETGTGGDNEKKTAKDNKISADEAGLLRKTDYKKWSEMVRSGKIAVDL